MRYHRKFDEMMPCVSSCSKCEIPFIFNFLIFLLERLEVLDRVGCASFWVVGVGWGDVGEALSRRGWGLGLHGRLSKGRGTYWIGLVYGEKKGIIGALGSLCVWLSWCRKWRVAECFEGKSHIMKLTVLRRYVLKADPPSESLSSLHNGQGFFLLLWEYDMLTGYGIPHVRGCGFPARSCMGSCVFWGGVVWLKTSTIFLVVFYIYFIFLNTFSV